jgi:muramidase (phage lysozyme)
MQYMNQNLSAFLRVIREGETSQTDDAYRTIVGGERFDSFADHPRKRVFIRSLNVWSTAAGAYQFLSRTWDECRAALNLPDFSPESQDKAAVFLIRRRKALDDVIAGRFEDAIWKCRLEWASLPGSPYGQPTKTMARARAVYERFGGQYAATPIHPAPTPIHAAETPIHPPLIQPGPEPADYYAPSGEAPEWVPPPPRKEPTMAPFVAAALPAIVQSIPQLAKLFGSGSEVAQRNIAAAETVVGIVQQAVGASNAQEAAELVQSDPQARQKAAQAIEAQWYTLTEAGGGGIAGARKAAVEASGGKPWQNPAMWITAALMPLVYMVTYIVLTSESFSQDVRSMVVGAVMLGTLGAVAQFWLGSSYGSSRKTDMLGK